MRSLAPPTIHRIELAYHDDVIDPRGRGAHESLRVFLALPIEGVRTLVTYKIHGLLDSLELDRIIGEFTDPVLERSALGRLPGLVFDWAVTIGFRPGVTDNLGRTALVAIVDTIGRPLRTEGGRDGAVFTEITYLLSGAGLLREDVIGAGREMLANELIQTVHVENRAEWYGREPDLAIPEITGGKPPAADRINLGTDDAGLLRISRERVLSLSLAEMKAIREHFADGEVQAERAAMGLGADPTDVELECIAQTWSEHCKHKIMNAVIHYEDPEMGSRETIRSLFGTYIRRVTEELAPELGWLVSVFHDNAGVVRMNDRTNLVYKVETHNSPSALDPYGGAITGIVGVNRDPFGTGRGAALLTNVWGYCFAPPTHSGTRPEGLLHPRRVREGVHRGVVDGGNQSGIPYSRGWEYFDERFLGKPLVFCGTVGVMPRDVCEAKSDEKIVRPGDLVVMVGGRIGKDGIHGATFSSAELSEVSPAQAVQIGDPITQKRMTDFLIEARDRCLFTSITDNGAGGLSSSVGELCRASGGADIDLARAPLKYEGLAPWEILLSEAQERMTVGVPADKEQAFLKLAVDRDVEATVLGTFTASGRFVARFDGEAVCAIALEFLHGGCPVMELPARWERRRHDEPPSTSGPGAAPGALDRVLLALHGRLNLASNEDQCRVYDHEVKGLSVVKPWIGVRQDVPSDATVMLVDHERPECVLLTEGVNPRLSDLDAGLMVAWSVDLAVRRAVAGGGEIGRLAGLDNYCWPDPVSSDATPDGAFKCAQLVRATKALYKTCHTFRLPLISGKDSMKNDSTRGGVQISVPPTLLVSVMGWLDEPEHALTLDVKEAGDVIYLLGKTGEELGGSEYLAWVGETLRDRAYVGNSGPRVDAEATCALAERVTTAARAGLIRSAHAPGLGGLAIALARMALGGDLGIEVDFEDTPTVAASSPAAAGKKPATVSDEALLFAESAGRFVIGVASHETARFEALFQGLPVRRIGRVTDSRSLRIRRGGRPLVDTELEAIRRAWQRPLALYAHRAAIPVREPGPGSVPAASPRPGAKPVRALVITGHGLNCEVETIHGLRTAGARVDAVHMNDFMAGKHSVLDYDILSLVGGFAFGDHLGAGTVLANRFRYRLGDEFRRFIREGRLILAICNGFQAAVKMGILPGFDGDYQTRRVTLAQNDVGCYRDSWVVLKANPSSPCVWTRGLDEIEVPVRHGEGKFFVRDAAVLDRIEQDNLVALRYADPETVETANEFPLNPNGSLNGIAGLCDPTGRIFGLMPHPDAILHPWNHPHWMRTRLKRTLPEAGAGQSVFRNGVDFVRLKKG